MTNADHLLKKIKGLILDTERLDNDPKKKLWVINGWIDLWNLETKHNMGNVTNTGGYLEVHNRKK